MKSRRDALKTIAVSAVLPAALGQTVHQHSAEEKPAAPAKARFFREDELQQLALLTDLIIPHSDTPGAAEAGVPMILDGGASRNKAVGQRWRDDLKWVKEDALKKYDSAHAMLTAFSTEDGTRGAAFFRMLKDSTIDAYYSTKEGFVQELGWHGNTFLTEFKGCTHKEHQS